MSEQLTDTIAEGWHSRRPLLAAYVLRHMVNRDDVSGAYSPLNKRATLPKNFTEKKRKVTAVRLQAHFAKQAQPEHVVGLHAISQDDTCLWVSVDIDNHSTECDTDTASRNLAYALKKCAELESIGLRPLLWDSNGKGGYHIDVLFNKPIPAADAYRFGLWIVRDWKESGFKQQPESFPKQPSNNGRYGNWLRIIGRHHTRDIWATVYNQSTGQWMEGSAAADAVLAHVPVDPASIPTEALRETLIERERRERRQVPRDYSTIPADSRLKRAAAYLPKVPPAVAGQRGHDQTFKVACRLVAFGLSRQEVFDLLSDWNDACDPPWSDGELWHKIDGAFAANPAPMPDRPLSHYGSSESGTADGKKPNESFDDPHRLARLFIGHHYTLGNGLHKLAWWQGAFWKWDGQRWVELKKHELIAELTSFIKAEFDRVNLWMLENWIPQSEADKEPEVKPVTRALLGNVENAIASIVSQPDRIVMPDWLCGDPPFPANEVLVTKSTLLHLPSLFAGQVATVPPTPMLFSANALTYDYLPDARCSHWQAFLQSVWLDDPWSVDALQEYFGYLLLPDTRHHKLLMLIGPARSGKGTITRVLQQLLGSGNVASPTLSSLSGPFGLWPLLNKYAALIPDARLSGRDDAVAVVERLLSLTGEDPQDVHRKNLPTLTGLRMPIRFVLASNELPNMKDASGAFMTRVLLLRMTESFVGREDRELGDRLAEELPGILNWSIAGLKRLRDRGHFIQPESANELLADLENLSSPVKQFIQDACEVGPGHESSIHSLYSAWQSWCVTHHRDHAGTTQTFGKDLRAALPQLRLVNRRDGESRERKYEGIRVRLDTGSW